MAYFKMSLSGMAALLLAEFAGPWSMFRGMSTEKATGLAAIVGGLIESVFSPLFWLLAFLLFGMFFLASRLEGKLLRVLLFWTPTLLVCTVSILVTSLILFCFPAFSTSVAAGKHLCCTDCIESAISRKQEAL